MAKIFRPSEWMARVTGMSEPPNACHVARACVLLSARRRGGERLSDNKSSGGGEVCLEHRAGKTLEFH